MAPSSSGSADAEGLIHTSNLGLVLGLPSDHVHDVHEDDKDLRELPDRDIAGSVLRYLGNVVAWRRAILYLTHSGPYSRTRFPSHLHTHEPHAH
ncbi:hypothetical protein BS47DRAFT_1354499 [Hydnum rufescens UP504]|uniref:Uncharacterized protein n=1 Tax=Hydnum rufescens UP504 TaxID=1448309 RepID=A0A9P6DHZ4_9AGAM|nr:hypothetical protein BS47DRAFT_1354499 [Hydnum rufescens UP504]